MRTASKYRNSMSSTSYTLLEKIRAPFPRITYTEAVELLCVPTLIAPEGYGEIIGGSERIHDYDTLKQEDRGERPGSGCL